MNKAYSVQAEETGCIVFSQHNIVARREGANELNCEFGEVSCKRAPEFDEYAEIGKVPVMALLAAGWWWECQNCSNCVYEDECVIHNEIAYCCEACRYQELAERIMTERRTQALIDCAHEKWHGVTVLHASECRGNGDVTFAFPGGANAARWSTKEDALYVSLVDHPAWAAFTGKPIEIIGRKAMS